MKYTLDPSSKKFTCPSCGQKKRFVRFIDESGNYAPDQYGRCDREQQCGYFEFPPKENKHNPKTSISYDIFKRSLNPHYLPYNSFVKGLTGLLGGVYSAEEINKAIRRYFVGSTKAYTGGVVFWQVDRNGVVRSGKIMQYNDTFHRTGVTNWVHTLLGLQDFDLNQCLFGEHLIRKGPPVAIVESEKTAIVMSVIYPDYTWIAAGQKNGLGGEKAGLNRTKTHVLKGHKILLYPDKGCYSHWAKITMQMQDDKIDAECMTILKDSDLPEGSDIADLVGPNINQPEKPDFLPQKPEKRKSPVIVDNANDLLIFANETRDVLENTPDQIEIPF